MRIRTVAVSLSIICVVALACASCSDTSSPARDTTAPQVDLTLSVHLGGDMCPAMVAFRANPMGSSDIGTERDSLRIRWDFNNDGAWETPFETIALQDGITVEPLPVGSWTVRCEVQDRAGNVAAHVKSLVLPEWVPVAPDIIAGAVTTWMPPWSDAPTDTISMNSAFTISVKGKEWIAPGGQELQTRFYVDDVLVDQQSEAVTSPHPQRCHCQFAIVSGGIGAPGWHEIRVVFDADDTIAESNEDNNVAVREVFVRE